MAKKLRSLEELELELQQTGEVRIPRRSLRSLASEASLVLSLALAGFAVLMTQPNPLGKWMLSATLLMSAALILHLNLRDRRRHIIVTAKTIAYPVEPPIPWSDILQIGAPASRSILSLHVTREGLNRHYGSTSSEDGDDRNVIVWPLSSDISESELRFLRDQAKKQQRKAS